MPQVFHIRESPLSPQSYSQSQLSQAQYSEISTQTYTSINFISGSDLLEEHLYENTSIYIEKEKEKEKHTLIFPRKYGLGLTIM